MVKEIQEIKKTKEVIKMKTIEMNISNSEDVVKGTYYVSEGMPREILINKSFAYESKLKCIVTLNDVYVGTTDEASDYINNMIKKELIIKGYVKQTGLYEFSNEPYYEIV